MGDVFAYERAVRRLAHYGYRVVRDQVGFFVQHGTNPADVALACTLTELVDLADLAEWRAQRAQCRAGP